MKKISVLLALLLFALACANPLTAPAPEQPANVETMVAATLSALTSVPPLSTPIAGDASSNLLPHSLVYLANDAAEILQVFRLEKDGKTVTQLTFEPSTVEEFDVSPVDGSIVFRTNHQLYLANADGSNRRLIFDPGPQDEVEPFLTRIISPVFSPNGQTIAFGHKGLNLYSIASGQTNRVIEDKINDLGQGLIIPEELYWPDVYTADGRKLIITLGYYEGASAAIYDINSNTLVRLDDSGQRATICCGDYSLSQDGSSLYAGSPSFGMFAAGLWKVDINTGKVSTLLLGDFETNPAEVSDNPYIAPDGQLYYFYASVPNTGDMVNRPPLQLVRSAADGVTGRTVLRPETFSYMNEALWAPDASFVIIANGSDQTYFGGEAQLYYTDGQKTMIPLLPSAQNMKWGP